jgi:uncharacterized delta-60 repeat protein
MRIRFRFLNLLCVALILALPGEAYAAGGALDTTFSDDGMTTIPQAPDSEDSAEDVIVQPDGKVVVVGWRQDFDVGTYYVMAARFLDDGTPDPAFGGGDGVVALPVGSAASGYALGLLSDQRIAIAGNVRISGSDWDMAAFLLTTAGDLDPAFDDDGIAIARFGPEHEVAFGLDVDASDRIVIGGRAEMASGLRMAAARFTSDGTLNASFSSDGKHTIRFQGQAQARDVEITPAGKIVLAGRRQSPGGFAVARLLAGGTLDTSFGGDGRVITGTAYGANAVAVQPDGRIIAAGSRPGLAGTDYMLVRYRRNGTLDPTFHRDGIARTDFAGDDDIAWDVEVQPNGKIIAVGEAYLGTQRAFGIARYRPSGVLDPTFSDDGKAGQVGGIGMGSTLDATPRLIAVGWFRGPMGVARYLLS